MTHQTFLLESKRGVFPGILAGIHPATVNSRTLSRAVENPQPKSCHCRAVHIYIYAVSQQKKTKPINWVLSSAIYGRKAVSPSAEAGKWTHLLVPHKHLGINKVQDCTLWQTPPLIPLLPSIVKLWPVVNPPLPNKFLPRRRWAQFHF